jgi:beta-glucosidase
VRTLHSAKSLELTGPPVEFRDNLFMKLLKTAVNPRLRLMAVALMIGVMLLDICVLELRYLVPDTVRPSDSNFVANPAGYGAQLTRLAEQTGKPCDMIFIGASNVERFCSVGSSVWEHYYAPRNAFNFGIGGDKTENVLWRFDHMNLTALKPKVAVIFIGLNNTNSTPREVTLGVKAIVKKSRAAFPGIKVIVVSLTPNWRDDGKIVMTNKLLRALTDNKNVYYVNIYARMPAQGDTWKGLGPDKFHLSEEGYQIWANQMEPLVTKLLAPLPPEPAVAPTSLTVTN